MTTPRLQKKNTLRVMLLGIFAALIACTLPGLGTVETQPPAPDSPAVDAFNLSNLASHGPAVASESSAGNPPGLAVDGDLETAWQPGAVSPQWIEIDLGVPVDIEQIRLIVQQAGAGQTLVKIYGRGPWQDDEYQLIDQLDAQTSDGQALEFDFSEPWLGIQFIKLETAASTSPVGWREIVVFPPKIDSYDLPYLDADGDGIIDQQDWCPDTPGLPEDSGC